MLFGFIWQNIEYIKLYFCHLTAKHTESLFAICVSGTFIADQLQFC